MTQRPADLPDFQRPPITESVLGVQFDSLSNLRVTDFGAIRDAFRNEYPHVEEHPPLAPVFEVFGESAPPNAMPHFELLHQPPLPRVFFVNQDRTRLLQVQRDRFLGNWRKATGDDLYPRFTANAQNFRLAYEKFESLAQKLGLGPVLPNQCELTYVNPIPLGGEFAGLAAFRAFAPLPSIDGLGPPEDGRFALRFPMRSALGAVGRLTASTEPAWTVDGKHVMQFTLTARGAPVTRDIPGIMEFFDAGHIAIVRAFTDLTTERMHKEWGRFQ